MNAGPDAPVAKTFFGEPVVCVQAAHTELKFDQSAKSGIANQLPIRFRDKDMDPRSFAKGVSRKNTWGQRGGVRVMGGQFTHQLDKIARIGRAHP